MSENIIEDKAADAINDFAAAAHTTQTTTDDDCEDTLHLPSNGRTTGRYARKGVNVNDCRYGC